MCACPIYSEKIVSLVVTFSSQLSLEWWNWTSLSCRTSAPVERIIGSVDSNLPAYLLRGLFPVIGCLNSKNVGGPLQEAIHVPFFVGMMSFYVQLKPTLFYILKLKSDKIRILSNRVKGYNWWYWWSYITPPFLPIPPFLSTCISTWSRDLCRTWNCRSSPRIDWSIETLVKSIVFSDWPVSHSSRAIVVSLYSDWLARRASLSIGVGFFSGFHRVSHATSQEHVPFRHYQVGPLSAPKEHRVLHFRG